MVALGENIERTANMRADDIRSPVPVVVADSCGYLDVLGIASLKVCLAVSLSRALDDRLQDQPVQKRRQAL